MLFLDWAIKVALIFAIALGISAGLRKRSAALRHLVWTAAVLTSVLLPLVGLFLPAWQPNLPAPAVAVLALGAKAAPDDTPADAGIRTNAIPAEWEWTTSAVVLSMWSGGAGLFLLALISGTLRLTWFARGAKPFGAPRWVKLTNELSGAFGLQKKVYLLQDSCSSMLITWGSFQPRILLPAGAENWSDDRIRAVLAHELAHIQRRDWLVQVMAEFAAAVYWFNPLVWIGSDRLRRESEHACDDAVIRLGFEASEYAEHLLALARSLKNSKRGWSPALAMARQSNLERRFLAMLNPSLNRGAVSRKAVLLTAVLALLFVLPLAAFQVAQQPATGKLAGGVYDTTGNPIPNATVLVWSEIDKTRQITITNAAGLFELDVPIGPHVLHVAAKDFLATVPETFTMAGGATL
ncbi:MAG: carboxypeptidase regulatory-like domain-containing protein, partial [Acidobacteria bacterium]|nr:carboxypeptidase regulatory-like domain-containing protein [Acidobacteriota bacterium]